MSKIESWHTWFEGKDFTSEWADTHFPIWCTVLEPRRSETLEILEIGSWEGRSAIFLLEFLPLSRITCIDNFAGGGRKRDPETMARIAKAEVRFDANLSPYSARLEKLRSRSLPALDALCQDNRHFDIVYIDGSHRRDDVLMDSVLSWQMLKDGGLLLWDDYRWGLSLPESERPGLAIDAFLNLHAGEYVLRSQGVQVIIEKTVAGGSNRATTTSVIMRPLPRTFRNLCRFLSGKPI